MWGWSQGAGSPGVFIRTTRTSKSWEETRGHAEVASQVVRYSQVLGVGGIPEGRGEQRCPGGGREVPGAVRGGSEERAVQDLESDELGDVLSSCGAGGGNTEIAWWWGPNARRAHDRRSSSPDCGGDVPAAVGGAEVPPRLVWVSAEQVAAAGGRGVPAAVLAEGLGHRS